MNIKKSLDFPTKKDHIRALSYCMDDRKARETSIRLSQVFKVREENQIKAESDYQIDRVLKGLTRHSGSSKTIPVKHFPEQMSDLQLDVSTANLQTDNMLHISPKDMSQKKPMVHMMKKQHPFIRQNNPVINLTRYGIDKMIKKKQRKVEEMPYAQKYEPMETNYPGLSKSKISIKPKPQVTWGAQNFANSQRGNNLAINDDLNF